ncbi:acyl-CoA dehydrogenase family protein [Clostridium niameyense]|uniref:acyl-CoA dehydrogenase family protein n=1 Tax=Clostridium niameyense TaxID=1622073 RepID=UPI00067E833A|nr:acyl-CoA dehydrogenase family protein [Clostridium niameyense]
MIFTEQHELIRKLARDFAEKEIETIADEVDKTAEFPKEVIDKMAKLGFFGIKMPKEYGGAGADTRAYVTIMEEISRASGVAGIYLSSPNSLLGTPFLLVGTEEQKEKYLKPMIKGEKKLAFALTEPGAGSDAGAIATTAKEDGDYYILNGRKTFITGAPISDNIIVFAKTDMSKGTKGITTFIVDSKQEGVSFGKPEEKMGMIGCPTSDIILENVKVHKSDILGEINKGFITAMKTLSVGRLGVAAQALGIAQAAVDEAVKYAKQRKQFNRPIAKFQAIQFKLADMETKLNAAKLLVYNAAYKMDKGEKADKEAAMAKYFAAESAIQIVNDALQIHGGYGYIKEYKVERLYRDVRVIAIYEGTSQVQQMVIASNLLK